MRDWTLCLYSALTQTCFARLTLNWRRGQRFCISKVKERDFFLNCVLQCNCKCVKQGCKRDCNLWIRKQYRLIAFKTMYVQFCNEAKSCAYWLVNETLCYETKTRPRHLIFSPRRDRDRDLPPFSRDRDETETFGNYVSRPSRDRDVETETTSLPKSHKCLADVHYWLKRCVFQCIHACIHLIVCLTCAFCFFTIGSRDFIPFRNMLYFFIIGDIQIIKMLCVDCI